MRPLGQPLAHNALRAKRPRKGQGVAAFGCPRPRRSLAGEGDLLAAEACLVADHGAGAALARQAVAHGDARWLALDRKVKLTAAAGGVTDGHGVGSVAIDIGECRLESKTMHHTQQNRARYPLCGCADLWTNGLNSSSRCDPSTFAQGLAAR